MTQVFEFRVKEENLESLARELKAQGLELIQCRPSGLHNGQYEFYMESDKQLKLQISTPYEVGISYPKVSISELKAEDIDDF